MCSDLLFRFIVIDDDKTSNLICGKYLHVVFPHADVRLFNRSSDGLQFIRANYPMMGNEKTILFLDIEMPEINGWEFLEEFVSLPGDVVQQFHVCLITSALYVREQEKMANPLIRGLMEKPMSVAKLNSLFSVVSCNRYEIIPS